MNSFILTLERILVLANQILASLTIIVAFSLFLFIIRHNRKSAIGWSFSMLLACICFTYVSDAALFQVKSLQDAIPWLRFQWIGIAFTPAAYLHFSDALLRTTNAYSQTRRMAVIGAYLLGGIFLYLAVFSNLLVQGGFFVPGITQFQAGPLFWLFSLYFFAAIGWGILNAQRARDRCLTSVTRRRMTNLMVAFVAPGFGVFPYMLIANQAQLLPVTILLAALLVVNVGIILMTSFMAYNVSFFDAFGPDRVVKYDLVTFLLRGPLIAGLVIIFFQALPEQSIILGIPRDAVMLSSIVAIIVLAQLLANDLKPVVSRLAYRSERDEVELLRSISSRLVTTTDLRQALENVLTTICELLRVRTGFVANIVASTGPRLETSVGATTAVETALLNFDAAIFKNQANGNGKEPPLFVAHGNFWYVPLKTQAGDLYLGLLGIEARAGVPDLTSSEQRTIEVLIQKAEFVLEDRRLQRNIFNGLRGFMPEMERAQRLRSAVRYLGSPVDNILSENSPAAQPDFPKMVHDALTHYWGGPKLSNSPLLNLKVVQQAMNAHNGNAVKALRSVLGKAIEDIRPNGERHLTTSEWLFYNILELKFIRGLKVRDVAQRLAMSEADFYRKQKIAIKEVARSLSDMETRGH